MARSKQKYYVVWKGYETGIFDSWNHCKTAVHQFEGAIYKSYTSLKEAKEAFLHGIDSSKNASGFNYQKTPQNNKSLFGTNTPIWNSISVDAACSGNPGIAEYQGVDTRTKKQIFYFGKLEQSTNNIAEFLALVHALAYLKKHNDPRPIYTDSKTAMSWVRKKKANTTLQKTTKNKDSFALMERAVFWLKNNTYTTKIIKWETKIWGEIPADFGRK